MAQQVLNALDELDQAMEKLKTAVEDIPIRREFFRGTHRKLTTAVAALSVEVADNSASFAGD